MKTLKINLMKCLCGFLLLGNFSCDNSGKQVVEKSVKVKTMHIAQSDNVYQREYIGTIESENTADLSFQVAGNVSKVFVKEGQNVHKGQLLASLDQTSLNNIYASAKASLAQVEDAFNRQTILYNNKSLPEIKYVEIKTRLQQAKSSEQIAKKNLDDCNLYAPFAGIIGTKSIEVGANVMPSIQAFSLINIGSVKVKISIPENSISAMQIGDKCKVNISAINNKEFEGVIVEKGVVSHPISHTYDIKVQLNNDRQEIMPGMVCKAYLANERQESIIVPLKTVQINAMAKNYVWVVDSSNHAEYREVKTGELLGNGIVIENGLTAGDIVITEGYQNVSPSVVVELAN